MADNGWQEIVQQDAMMDVAGAHLGDLQEGTKPPERPFDGWWWNNLMR